MSVYGEGDVKLGKVYDIYEIESPFDGEKYKGAFNTETRELEFQVKEDLNTGAFIIVEDDVDPQTAKTLNSGEGFDNYTPTDGFDGQIPDDGLMARYLTKVLTIILLLTALTARYLELMLMGRSPVVVLLGNKTVRIRVFTTVS